MIFSVYNNEKWDLGVYLKSGVSVFYVIIKMNGVDLSNWKCIFIFILLLF